MTHRVDRLQLVGERGDRVAAAAEQRPDPSRSVEEDLLGERAARHAREGEAESPDAGRFAEAVRGRGINRLSFGDLGRGEGTEGVDRLARLEPVPADGVDAEREVLHQRAVSGKVRTGSGDHVAASGAREDPGGPNEVVGLDPGVLGDGAGVEGTHGRGQCVDVAHVLVGETLVVEALVQDHVEHRRKDRDVVPRAGL